MIIRYTLDDNIFSQNLTEKITYDPEKKEKNIKLIYDIWSSPFYLTRLRYSPHYYIDFTFIKNAWNLYSFKFKNTNCI